MLGESSSHITSGSRRLMAIMSADIAGFSRLMGQDEEGTHERLKRYRRDIIEPTVAEHHGQIVKHLGDGFLAIFESPLEAVRCALVIQQTVAARNTSIAKASWLQFRIGINLGDVIVEPDDIYGDGVNVAARLQTAAEPGGVNISSGVYEQVKNKLVCGYRSLGDEKLKNITDPVRIYKVLPDPAAMGSTKPIKRTLQIGGGIGFALLVAFGAGLWVANRQSASWRNPSVETTVAAAPAAPAQPASQVPAPVQHAVRDPLSTMPVPIPAMPPALPPIASGIDAQAGQPTIPAASPAAPSQPSPSAAPEARVAAIIGPQQAPQSPTNTFRDCQFCPEMVRLPGGTFSMGNADDAYERPVRQVKVAPFAIGRSPVTLGEWRLCVQAKSCQYTPTGDDDVPVHNVSWDDAQQFVRWLSQATSKPYRLPSEAEWEYAARGGTTTPYWWGSAVAPGVANCKGCIGPGDGSGPIKVGVLRANPFGLYDMAGGVAEWVSDCWHPNYQGAPRDGSSWDAPNCRQHVLRGSSWYSDPTEIRVTSRSRYDTGVRYPSHGFRVALSVR